MFDLDATQLKVDIDSEAEQLHADRSIGLYQLANSSTRRRRIPDEAGHDSLLRPVVFDLGATQRQVDRGSGPEQQQAGRSIGLEQLATSSTRRRRGHNEAGHGFLLRLVAFDLGATQRQVDCCSGPEQQQAGRLIGFDQLTTLSTRR